MLSRTSVRSERLVLSLSHTHTHTHTHAYLHSLRETSALSLTHTYAHTHTSIRSERQVFAAANLCGQTEKKTIILLASRIQGAIYCMIGHLHEAGGWALACVPFPFSKRSPHFLPPEGGRIRIGAIHGHDVPLHQTPIRVRVSGGWG